MKKFKFPIPEQVYAPIVDTPYIPLLLTSEQPSLLERYRATIGRSLTAVEHNVLEDYRNHAKIIHETQMFDETVTLSYLLTKAITSMGIKIGVVVPRSNERMDMFRQMLHLCQTSKDNYYIDFEFHKSHKVIELENGSIITFIDGSPHSSRGVVYTCLYMKNITHLREQELDEMLYCLLPCVPPHGSIIIEDDPCYNANSIMGKLAKSFMLIQT